jgi:hypothetical protein
MRSKLGRFHRPMSRGAMGDMLTMNSLGDGSTLSLDFTTGVLDSRLTFTRSTTATYINSSGYVTSAAINAPRFDYSPTNTGEPRGLLIEGQTANLTKYSEAFTNAYWNTTANNVTAADSVATSPTGVALTASTLTEIAGTVSRHVYQVTGEFTPAASTAYTMSCFVKQPTSNAIRYVQLAFWSAGFGLTAYMNYDLQAGTVGTGGAGITAPSITAYPNGWYRITATATSIAVPGSSGFQLGFSTTSGAVRTESYTASAPLKSIQLFGAQVEVGSGATSYISTGASQVTRTLDTCYMSGISSWFNESAGTVISNLHYNGSATDNSGIELSVGTGSSPTNRIGIRKGYVDYYSGGVNSAEMYPTVTSGNVRIGTAYSLNDFAMCSNGGTMRTDVTGAVPVGLNTLKLYADNGTSSLVLNGLIKSIKYFPTRLSNAQLQTLTAP